MDDELAKFTKGGPPTRVKKLERYAQLILASQDLGWSYRAIAARLRSAKRLSVAPATVWRFIRQHRPSAAPASDTKPTPTPAQAVPAPQPPTLATNRQHDP